MTDSLTPAQLDEIERLARYANEAGEGIMRRYAALTTLLTPTVVLALVALAREGQAALEAKGKTVEEPNDYNRLIKPRDGYNDNALRPW